MNLSDLLATAEVNGDSKLTLALQAMRTPGKNIYVLPFKEMMRHAQEATSGRGTVFIVDSIAVSPTEISINQELLSRSDVEIKCEILVASHQGSRAALVDLCRRP